MSKYKNKNNSCDFFKTPIETKRIIQSMDQGSRKFLSLTLATSSKQMVQMLRRRIGTIIIVVRIFLRIS